MSLRFFKCMIIVIYSLQLFLRVFLEMFDSKIKLVRRFKLGIKQIFSQGKHINNTFVVDEYNCIKNGFSEKH